MWSIFLAIETLVFLWNFARTVAPTYVKRLPVPHPLDGSVNERIGAWFTIAVPILVQVYWSEKFMLQILTWMIAFLFMGVLRERRKSFYCPILASFALVGLLSEFL